MFSCQNHPLGCPYPLFFAGHGVFSPPTPIGKKLFFRQCQNRAGTGRLSYRFEPDRRDARRAGRDPGSGTRALLRYQWGDIRNCRNWAYSAGGQYRDAAGANQAQHIRVIELI